MSISFAAQDLKPTYQAIIDGSADYDWALFNQTANELKVQATGSGLDDLEEEFMDGRYVWERVLVTYTQHPICIRESQGSERASHFHLQVLPY